MNVQILHVLVVGNEEAEALVVAFEGAGHEPGAKAGVVIFILVPVKGAVFYHIL